MQALNMQHEPSMSNYKSFNKKPVPKGREELLIALRCSLSDRPAYAPLKTNE